MQTFSKKLLGFGVLLLAFIWLFKDYLAIHFSLISLLLSGLFGYLSFNFIKNKNIFPFILTGALTYHFLSRSYLIPLPYFGFWRIVIFLLLIFVALSILGLNKTSHLPFSKNISVFYQADEEKEKFITPKNTNIYYEDESERIQIDTFLSENIRYIHSKQTRKIDINNLFGQTTLYFQEKQPLEKKLYVDISNALGEVILYIPHGWRIESDVKTFLGESSSSAFSSDQFSEYTVYVQGYVVLASLSIRYF